MGARDSVIGWGTMLQAGRSRVRIPRRSLDFFNLPDPSSSTMTLGSTQPLTEMCARNYTGGKGRPATCYRDSFIFFTIGDGEETEISMFTTGFVCCGNCECWFEDVYHLIPRKPQETYQDILTRSFSFAKYRFVTVTVYCPFPYFTILYRQQILFVVQICIRVIMQGWQRHSSSG
jgi:hypothetical protein